MTVPFSVPIHDENGDENLSFKILSAALEGYISQLSAGLKADPDNDQISDELAAALVLSMDLQLFSSKVFLEKTKPKSSKDVDIQGFSGIVKLPLN